MATSPTPFDVDELFTSLSLCQLTASDSHAARDVFTYVCNRLLVWEALCRPHVRRTGNVATLPPVTTIIFDMSHHTRQLFFADQCDGNGIAVDDVEFVVTKVVAMLNRTYPSKKARFTVERMQQAPAIYFAIVVRPRSECSE
jgi:hypothetical protein